MKKFLCSFLIALSCLSYSQPSKAMGGIMSGNIIIAAVGGLSMIAGVPVSKIANQSAKEGNTFKGAVFGVLGAILWVGGGYLLDEQNLDYAFTAIKKENLSEAERIYNSELEELNAVKDMVASDITKLEFNDLSELDGQVKELWDHYGQALSPETLAVRAQIISKLLK